MIQINQPCPLLTNICLSQGTQICAYFKEGCGYRTIDGSLNLKPYLAISCNVTVMHEENAVGFVET